MTDSDEINRILREKNTLQEFIWLSGLVHKLEEETHDCRFNAWLNKVNKNRQS